MLQDELRRMTPSGTSTTFNEMAPPSSGNGLQSGGFLPLLGMIASIIGGIGKLFTGQGLDFPLDEEGKEKKEESYQP